MGQAHSPLNCKTPPSRLPRAKAVRSKACAKGNPISSLLLWFGLITLLIKEGKLPYFTHGFLEQKSGLCILEENRKRENQPTFNLSQHQGLFQWISSSHQVAKVLELQLQSFQWIFSVWDGLVGSPCSPTDSQESSPTPQFKSINSLVLSLLCGPTLTSTHDYWKNHSFK